MLDCKKLISVVLTFFFLIFNFLYSKDFSDSRIVALEVNPTISDIQFFHKDKDGNLFKNINGLKKYLVEKKQKLLFAMNGGMYDEEFKPVGLYIESGQEKFPLNLKDGYGNFYLKPNGVFSITKNNKASISVSESFKNNTDIQFATQSGPMLLVDGKIHSRFKKNSKNLNIRNGVCILDNGKIIFAISKIEINFYEFANFFKELNCKNALYLDGFVSRAYIPDKQLEQLEGSFGIIIAVISREKNN